MTNVERDNLRTVFIASACGVAAFLALALAGVSLIVRFDATNQARANNARVWHAVICNIETTVIAKKGVSLAQKRYAVQFYDHLLVSDVHSAACGLEVKP